MRKSNISLAIAAVLILTGFSYLAVSSGAASQKLQMKTIKLQSTEQKLNSINIQYQKLDTQLKTQSSSDKDKINDLKAQQEQLLKEKADLEVKLQAKVTAQQKLAQEAASAAQVATATQTAYAYGGSHQDWMAGAGISSSDYGYVDYIISRESGWNPNATNASSGAHGLPQALPYSKTGCGWSDPVCQLQWASGYAVSRYGSWAGAYSFWTQNHWW